MGKVSKEKGGFVVLVVNAEGGFGSGEDGVQWTQL